MKRILFVLVILCALLCTLTSSNAALALFHEDVYGDYDPEFGIDYGPPSGHDSMRDLMMNELGCLAFLAVGYIAWVGVGGADGWRDDPGFAFYTMFFMCGAFAPFSMFCVEHLGSDQNLVWLGIIGYAIYLFRKRRREK